ncbi:DUF1800 domain-containing protein, partial [Xanthomonas perforans]|nr:DUF1800 domain-containing protein [Xanthomonas perforans]
MFEQVGQAVGVDARVAHVRRTRGWRVLPLLIGSLYALTCTAAETPLTPSQMRWLQRATYGVDASSATQLTRLG